MKYRGDLICRHDDILLNQKRFEDEKRRQRETIMKGHYKARMPEKIKKETEEFRRHDEQVYYLYELMKDCKNALEQRKAIIQFMVEEMIKSEQPKKS